MGPYQKLHDRYEVQSRWSKPFREYLYRKLCQEKAVSILEVGCGTGAILNCITREYKGKIHSLTGVDIDSEALTFSKEKTKAQTIRNDGENLCFANECFDLICCHYLLMWVKEPVAVVSEMKRVLKTGGICSAFAEPDYGVAGDRFRGCTGRYPIAG